MRYGSAPTKSVLNTLFSNSGMDSKAASDPECRRAGRWSMKIYAVVIFTLRLATRRTRNDWIEILVSKWYNSSYAKLSSCPVPLSTASYFFLGVLWLRVLFYYYLRLCTVPISTKTKKNTITLKCSQVHTAYMNDNRQSNPIVGLIFVHVFFSCLFCKWLPL